MFPKQTVVIPMLAVWMLACLSCQKSGPVFNPDILPYGQSIPSEGITLVPESERPLDFFVMGIDPIQKGYFLLPTIDNRNGVSAKQLEEMEKKLYWLNFELSHGAIMRFLPPNSNLFASVPWVKSAGGTGDREKAYFREYLAARCGWTKADIESRVHFFLTPATLVWAQDLGEILGRDAKNRAVINIGQTGQMSQFRRDIRDLVKAFPEHFKLKVLPEGINAEGGDEELARTPNGEMAFMVGRHRVLSYLEYRDGVQRDTYNEKFISESDIEEARTFISKAFYGLPVWIVPEKVLTYPDRGNNELFHLDMVASVLYNHKNTPDAFVPTYLPGPVDATLNKPLDKDFVAKAQREYDLVARQLKSLGYKITRLPFADHPVRGPVNFVKYYDRNKDRFSVLLPKYPYHLSLKYQEPEHLEMAVCPNMRIKSALDSLDEKAFEWQENLTADNFRRFMEAIDGVWREMAEVEQQPNPIFETQAELIRRNGYDVVGIPSYPGGSGGLHCQSLR
jgi:hypothetical protein